jgi:LuxR family transcriptional regulator, maltose regulon positive regulatory protein
VIDRSLARAAECSTQAIGLAERHGWTDEPSAGNVYGILGSVLAWQGLLEEAEPWIERAERTVTAEAEPTSALHVSYTRGLLELARGHDQEALAAFRTAERLTGHLAVPTFLVPLTRARLLLALVRLGETERAEQVLAGLGEQDRQCGEIRTVIAVLRLAQHDPHAATAALAPVLDGSAAPVRETWLVEAFVLEAIARDALGDPAAAERALERALDLAEPAGAHLLLLLQPAPGLLERHARHRPRHAALIAEILDVLAGRHGRAAVHGELAPSRARADAGGAALRLTEPLSKSEIRVLRYLPTNLSAPEIARELSVSVATVRTHMRHMFVKLGVHRRTEAVARARALGLLA